MCGILLYLLPANTGTAARTEEGEMLYALQKTINRRGPDQHGAYLIASKASHIAAVLCSSVLHIQGSTIVEQPYVLENGDVLAYNGEIFGGEYYDTSGACSSDTPVFAHVIHTAIQTTIARKIDDYGRSIVDDSSQAVAEALAKVEGPYAFIYFSRQLECFIFGRDPFGRRSLISISKEGRLLALTSVVSEELDLTSCDILEISIKGIFVLPLSDRANELCFCPWPTCRIQLGGRTSNDTEVLACQSDQQRRTYSEFFVDALKSSIQRRVNSLKILNKNDPLAAHSDIEREDTAPICSVGVLFSGGIDSVLLSAVLHTCLPPDEPIDLINVTFDGTIESSGDSISPVSESLCLEIEPLSDKTALDSVRSILDAFKTSEDMLLLRTIHTESSKITQRYPSGKHYYSSSYSPDRLAAFAALIELRSIFPSRVWRLVCVDVNATERLRYEERVKSLILPRKTHMDLNIGTAFWFASRGAGYLLSRPCSDGETSDISLATLKLGEIYDINDATSGRPLLRRGFEGFCRSEGRLEKSASGGLGGSKCTVDDCNRKIKKGCVRNMCKGCCFRAKNSGDISDGLFCTVHKDKKGHPRAQTADESPEVMDSLGTADTTSDSVLQVPYISRCRALLVGIGADEQMAGYSRHRTKFKSGGVAALVAELNKDTERLWDRNLGRDDRCVSDHGRECWFPFIDEEVVKLLKDLPMNAIADLDLDPGIGDKAILRGAARLLGLNQCTLLVKRAIQFGTRIAMHTNVMYHGSNRKGKGDSLIERQDDEND